jgi:hypothetical protein
MKLSKMLKIVVDQQEQPKAVDQQRSDDLEAAKPLVWIVVIGMVIIMGAVLLDIFG